jgi:hypothetical protein
VRPTVVSPHCRETIRHQRPGVTLSKVLRAKPETADQANEPIKPRSAVAGAVGEDIEDGIAKAALEPMILHGEEAAGGPYGPAARC